MIRRTMVLLGLVLAWAAVAMGTAPSWGQGTPGPDTWTPPDDTIVAIAGGRHHGFDITYLDGSHEYPPTITEALTECTEYHLRVRRVRCSAEVRTRYRDLTAIRHALRYAHGDHGH